jgi:lipopolysaccharide/colanic/teichoic acid biosynthesis glycosyltransferase
MQESKQIIKPREDWSFDKRGQFLLNLLIGAVVFAVVPLNFAPYPETLLLIERSWLVVYSIMHGLAFAVSLEVFGRYEIDAITRKFNHFLFILFSASLSATLLILVIWLIEYNFIGRYVVVYVIFGCSLLCFLLSLILSKIDSLKKTQVLLLVEDSSADRIRKKAKDLKIPFQWILSSQTSPSPDHKDSSENVSADIVVTDHSSTISEKKVIHYVSVGTKISPIELFWGESFRSLPPEYASTDWLMGLDLHLRSPFNKRIKRLIDLIIASFGIILFFPLLVIAALAIALESGFPIFFSQSRSGYGGYPYQLHKLRTMKQKAEENGPQWAEKKDSRVTKVGKFLRKWRIDEIPQFWNIIKGEMSIVGPRPERPEFDKILSNEMPQWHYRSLVKPGLTGWAQIRSQYASDEESSREKLAHDLYYIKQASFFFDMEIVLSTLRSLNKGSR